MSYLYSAIAIFIVVFIGIVLFVKSGEECGLASKEYLLAARLAVVVTFVLMVSGAVIFDFLPWLLVDVLWNYL